MGKVRAGTPTSREEILEYRALALAVSLGVANIAGAGDGAPSPAPRVTVTYRPAAEAAAEEFGRTARAANLDLKSGAALVVGQDGGRVLYAKNAQNVMPIASITKLMTAMVALDARLPLERRITITEADIDDVKRTRSRLKVGTTLTRDELLQLALMASENRAAAALARTHAGGSAAFVAAMNQKAIELGMWRTRFVDATGLSSDNVSTAQDLVKMVRAAYDYALIREYTTAESRHVSLSNGRALHYRNSNGLVKNKTWQIGLSKTGYISEAGRCLVMQARIGGRAVIIVLLDSWGKYTRIGDANRIRKWIESGMLRKPLG
ncbi:MAG: D-alanyl-D-alanine endopeptidase [Betaproteobacteria bacterium]|nr:D-alanyl-D-alanine endopeptidase [Betaproteobacteria bacterium]